MEGGAQMKRKFSKLLLAVMTLLLTACGNSSGGGTSASVDSKAEKVSAGQQEQTQTGGVKQMQTGKVLIVYFSHSGNTKAVAEWIRDKTGGALFRVETATPYPTEYNRCVELAKQEQQQNARPRLVGQVEALAAYNTIFIGYPNWWNTMPMALFTFLEENDFSGKKIVPFCTHGGSGLGRGPADIARLCPGAAVLDGLAIRGAAVADGRSEAAVETWLRSMGLAR